MIETKKIQSKKSQNKPCRLVSENRLASLLRIAVSRGVTGLLAVATSLPVAAESNVVPKILPRRSKAISISPPRETVSTETSTAVHLIVEAPRILMVPEIRVMTATVKGVVTPIKLDDAVDAPSLTLTTEPSLNAPAGAQKEVLIPTEAEILPAPKPGELPPPSPNPFPRKERRGPDRIDDRLSQPTPLQSESVMPLPPEPQAFPEPLDAQDGFGLQAMPYEPQQPTQVSPPQKEWIDIRPRSIGENEGALFTREQLPDDTSGLPEQDSTPQLIQIYQADLLMRDTWWGASFCHRPLYFEDPYLERYGTTGCLFSHCPSIRSGVHFLWKAGALPISMALDPPHQYVGSGFKTPHIRRLAK